MTSKLIVIVISATNLPNLEVFSKSDPYCLVEFQGIKKQTRVIDDELNPNWNETFEFDLGIEPLKHSEKLVVTVKDYESIGVDKFLGTAEVALSDLVGGKREMQVNLRLNDANKRPNGGTINLSLTYKPAGGNKYDDKDDTGVDNADDDDNEEETGQDQEPADPGAPATGKRKRKKAKKVTGRRRTNATYSNKTQDFQIRVKVVEARQLHGANISPVCRVVCWNQTKQTRVKKSTNSPFWDESFFFNFYTAPATLFDEVITFSVYNSGKLLRSDALIGSFKFDIGMIYEEDKHCFKNKWLLLCDPEDPMAGSKGYLKFCAVVLGPGDEAPSFKGADDEESDDIELNLLRPAGVQLRPATFILRLYKAEDLPRMDSDAFQGLKKVFGQQEQKELVDPYILVFFAGKEVKSSIKYCNDHPDWNEELRIPLQFPSMCQRIKIQAFDWDRMTEDDAIGTFFLDLSQISIQGESGSARGGFLPTFGPCFINLYGSPREFSDLPDENEALNLGKGEGVAYRGRVLFELETVLGDSSSGTPDSPGQQDISAKAAAALGPPVTEIPADTVARVQKYLRRRKYRLHVAFLSASMISCEDAAVEFEVSIGNYGNKLDETVPPSSSTTQPTNAVFDGTYYHFLPWGNSKPCTVVESHWEDISFRLSTINFFLRIIERLSMNIEKIKVAMKANLPEEDQAHLVVSAFDDFIIQCSKDLPQWETGQSPENELDLMLRSLRVNELRSIRKEAARVREEATRVDGALGELEGYLARFKSMLQEPQNSMPDVVLWMICGDKRIAYYRIPANDVLYSKNEEFMGRYCGTVECIQFRNYGTDSMKIPALLRCKIWLGQEKDEQEWHKMQVEGELVIVAETYENQVSLMGKWCTTGPLMTRPAWSDSSGRIEMRKEVIQPPDGWKWDSDWELAPELSLFYDKDAGLTSFLEEVYTNESRKPGLPWEPAAVQYTDVKGDSIAGMAETKCPEGWAWADDWQVDLNRPCDEEGWEYTVEASMGGYVPVEKMYHMARRRRFVRPRNIKENVQLKKTQAATDVVIPMGTGPQGECWEYAPVFSMKFHGKEHKMDMVRRRRWHRKMAPTKPNAPCFFQMSSSDPKAKPAAPRMFLMFKKPRKWQLRVYLYQGRDLLAADSSGVSDPYARVAFMNQSQKTEMIEKTRCPTWDQTMIFHSVDIYGDPQSVVIAPPRITIEIYDHDQLGEDEFMGRCIVTPMVKLQPDDHRRPVLQWHSVSSGERSAGEILAAFELFLIDGASKDVPFTPSRIGNIYTVPSGIRPVMQRTAIEILCWGVRNMKKYQLSNVTSPSIEFDIAGYTVTSGIIKNTSRNPNFDNPLLLVDVMLPKEELYMPPMNIRVIDHRNFGRKPMVGVHVLKEMDQFRFPPLAGEMDPLADLPGFAAVIVRAESQDLPTSDTEHVGATLGKLAKKAFSVSMESLDAIDDRAGTEMPSGGVIGPYPVSMMEERGDSLGRSSSPVPPDTPAVLPDALDADKQEKKKKKRFKFFRLKKKKKKSGEVKARMFNVNFFKREDGQKIDLSQLDEDIDWWSKYYASLGEWTKCRRYKESGYATMKLYNCELEKAEQFLGFEDFCCTFNLMRGKCLEPDEDESANIVGQFKGTFRIYALPEDRSEPMPRKYLEKGIPASDPVECIVRVYVVKAYDLQPNDSSGLADPYVEISIGKKTVDCKDEYIPNSLAPVFGKMFELKCTIPIQKDLYIRVKDYDLLGTDDVIGETHIDLENRYLTKFRATCGIPQIYCISGPNQWRDAIKPKALLAEYCEKNYIPAPEYDSNISVKVGNRTFILEDMENDRPFNPHYGPADERLALYVLNHLPLVKEHVETRALFSPLQPGIEQGKLQLWVDLFPTSLGEPCGPIDIRPRSPKKYVLRIIIWNTRDVILEETSITGEKMSDIYVKGWMAGIDERQETDVHYRSLDGTGNFNWRFVFPFEYLPAENVMVVRKKEHFWSLDETEQRIPPHLVIQIWDNDKFSADDFLGTLELDLASMPAPSKKSRTCDLTLLPAFNPNSTNKIINLFDCRRAYGFWPCYNDETGKAELTGKVEMELELLSLVEAEAKPAGIGRDEPNENPHLDPPNRPDTSFLWFASPWKTFKYIIWKKFKYYFIAAIFIILIGLLIALFIYAIPGIGAQKMLGM